MRSRSGSGRAGTASQSRRSSATDRSWRSISHDRRDRRHRARAHPGILFVGGDEAALAPLVPAGWAMQPQRGDDFGARIEHAFQAMFARGATCAVISGSDAPLVNIDAIAAALARVGDHEFVLGPFEDGGYSLLALTRPAAASGAVSGAA